MTRKMRTTRMRMKMTRRRRTTTAAAAASPSRTRTRRTTRRAAAGDSTPSTATTKGHPPTQRPTTDAPCLKVTHSTVITWIDEEDGEGEQADDLENPEKRSANVNRDRGGLSQSEFAKKKENMFLNYKVLNEKVRTTMLKYGLRG
jgi:hypothetical protein